jgi:hypothetical protein
MSAIPAWLEGARGAPSAHNTQPWRFVPRRDGSIVVRWDPERTLPAGDPTSRDLYLALGTSVESARLRAGRAGSPLTFVAAASGDESRTIGTLTPTDEPLSVDDMRLAALLDVRHTARVPHLPRPVSEDVESAMRDEAARFGCQMHLVRDRTHIRRLAALSRQATADQFAEPAVHAELWRWLRLDPRDPAYRRDGLTADCLDLRGMSLLAARLTMPPPRMRRLARLGVHHLLTLDTERVVRHSASLCLLTAEAHAHDDLVRAGQGLLRLWLLAAEAGLTTHPVSALLDCTATVAPTLEVFDCVGEYPVAIFRLGAAPEVPRAPRLPADELVEASGDDDSQGGHEGHGG